MQHRRWANVGEDPKLVDAQDLRLFLSEDVLEAANNHVESLKSRPTSEGRQRISSEVPSGALDESRDSHRAAQERADNEDNGKYASKGLVAIVCRHDIPLLLRDMETPGERQYFAIALIRKLATCLLTSATIGILYDTACQIDRSTALVRFHTWNSSASHRSPQHGFLPDISHRLTLAAATFHAYTHQFFFHMVFRPPKRVGFGWTNGEGNERVWGSVRTQLLMDELWE